MTAAATIEATIRRRSGTTRGDGVGGPDDDVQVPRTVAALVGRSSELAALVGVLDSAADATAAVAVLGGDAGVGKTRLLTETVAEANSRDMTILLGHCVDLGDTPPPYLAISEAFVRLAAADPEQIEELLRTHPADRESAPGPRRPRRRRPPRPR